MFIVKSGMNSGMFAVFFVIEHFLSIILSTKEVYDMKSIFEQIGGTYTLQGDYLLPNLALPAEKETGNIGMWALRHKRYLKQHHKVLYYNLLTSGKLHSHLADTEEQAQELFSRLVKEYAEKEGITEQLKSTDQMKWVGKMNAIRNAATEIINRELIYT